MGGKEDFDISQSTPAEVLSHFPRDKFQLKLVNGEFDPGEAGQRLAEILITHQKQNALRNLSNQERFGQPDAEAEKQLSDLKHFHKYTQELLEFAKANDLQLRIEANLKVSLL